ncbi:hypothetical protein, partial [Campylobacter jejuni]|uniref:hypothetical protein n=1 Tax=Campylobacter jejuni TaxID=197 RepID=UPI0027DFD033
IGTFAGSDWTVGNLAVGEKAILNITLRPSKGMEGKVVKNTAEVWQATSVDQDSIPGNAAQGEDDGMTVFVTVGAPRP